LFNKTTLGGMSNIKSNFSICDMENISGIKAHTIRIWEKRYNFLQPSRAGREIRTYDLPDLQKLLNITYLLDYKYKISQIAPLPNEELEHLVKNLNNKVQESNAFQQLKVAMFSFDSNLFESMYQNESKNKTFGEIFKTVFMPFLSFIGVQWQTNTISIAHEHFITNLIFQKIQLQTALISSDIDSKGENNKTYVLYLPEEEMHEIGLLYLNYELLLKGYKTIYLGRSVPLKDMEILNKMHNNLVYIAWLTISWPEKDFKNYYEKCNQFIASGNAEFYLFGYNLSDVGLENKYPKIKFINNPTHFITSI
jgi:MerR family transcriptional regulator, light-induced transcriptional regulator